MQEVCDSNPARRVTGKSIPSLWRDEHPAIKGLGLQSSAQGMFHPDQKVFSELKQNAPGLLLCQPLTCNPVAEIALHLLILCFASLSAQGSSSPEECFSIRAKKTPPSQARRCCQVWLSQNGKYGASLRVAGSACLGRFSPTPDPRSKIVDGRVRRCRSVRSGSGIR